MDAPVAAIRLRILSWNVHGLPFPFSKDRRARLARLAAEIEREAPELVALQEAWGASVSMLLRALPSYHAHFQASARTGSSGGLLLLVRNGSGWTEVGAARFRRFSLQGPAWKLWQGDGAAGKGAIFLALARGGERTLWLVATHLQSRYPAQPYREVRVAQLRELAQWIDELGDAVPVILAGDLNTPAGEDEHTVFIVPLGFDLTGEFRLRCGGTTNYPTRSSQAWIDYVIVAAASARRIRGESRLILNRGVDDPYSDHHGLVVDVEIA